MPERPRSPNAVRRASFGRADRLKREAADSRPTPSASDQKPDKRGQPSRKEQPRQQPSQDRGPAVTRTAARERKLTALFQVQERIERADARAERQGRQRLEEQTRATFNRAGERRRDTAGRVEQDRRQQEVDATRKRAVEHRRREAGRATERKRDQVRLGFNRAADRRRVEQERTRQHVDATRKRAEDHRRGAARKATERKRDQMRAAFNKEADRRRDVARRLEHDRLRQRAAAEIEREQKRRLEDQKAQHGRQRDAARTSWGIARDSFRDNETAALERHHGRIGAINNREDRELADFDGRRKGLAGRAAELIPGRRAANDEKRAGMVRGYEAERLAEHRDLEALKVKQHDKEQKTRLAYFRELKDMQGQHRDDRAELRQDQADARSGLVEDRARAIERADRALEQQHEHQREEQRRENVGLSGEFGRAASDHGWKTGDRAHGIHRDVGREMA